MPGVDGRAGGLWLTVSGARSAAGPSRLQQRAKGKGLTLGMAPLAKPVVMHQYRKQQVDLSCFCLSGLIYFDFIILETHKNLERHLHLYLHVLVMHL